MQRDEDRVGQTILKTMDKIHQWFIKIMRIVVDLGTLGFLAAALYYGICGFMGLDQGEKFSLYLVGFLMFAALSGTMRLITFLMDRAQKKEDSFDPRTMKLPERGTLTLEGTLRHMTVNVGVIMWDTIFITLLVILFGMMLTLGGNVPLILMICFGLAVFLVGGHLCFRRFWKRRSYSKKLLNASKEYISVKNLGEYEAALEESLKSGVLYYGMELVLTNEFIIGNTMSGLSFLPVAVPRAGIADMTFYCRRPVLKRYQKYDMGVLACRMYGGKTVEFLIGQGPRMVRVLKVLNYYQISWKEGELVYE